VNKDISISLELQLDSGDDIRINFMLMSRFTHVVADGNFAYFDAVSREAFKGRTGLHGATKRGEIRIMTSCGRPWYSTSCLVRRYKDIGQGSLGKSCKYTKSEKLGIRTGRGENDFRVFTAEVANDAVAHVSEPLIEGNSEGRFNISEAF
jgi:hypothetical protein